MSTSSPQPSPLKRSSGNPSTRRGSRPLYSSADINQVSHRPKLLYRRSLQDIPTDKPEPSSSVNATAFSNVRPEQQSKWSFLQRLMEIEEAHDIKKKARERRRASELNKNDPASNSSGETPRGMISSHSVPFSLWTQGQVLEDAPSDESSPGPYQEQRRNWEEPSFDLQAPSRDFGFADKLPDLSDARSHGDHKSSIEDKSLFDSTSSSKSHTNSDDYHRSKHQRLGLSLSMNSLNTDCNGKDTSLSTHQYRSHTWKPRQLRLPPLLLPKIYSVPPRPLKHREFLTPTKLPGPITDREWEDLKDCRYIRHVVFGGKNSQKVS